MEKDEELKRFFQEATSNQEIRNDLKSHNSREEFCSKAAEHGKKLGYDFSEEHVRNYVVAIENQELSDRELDVSGGKTVPAAVSVGYAGAEAILTFIPWDGDPCK